MRTLLLLIGLLAGSGAAGRAMAQPGSVPAPGQEPTSIQRLCSEGAEAGFGPVHLPNSARALRDRKQLRVLAIGATPLNARDRAQGHYALVERVIEGSVKGVEVEIIDRGVSGELARDAALRIQNEVALLRPDLVFWQVGVADALALTPADELRETLSRTIRWLKAHDVDVVLIGLRYQRSLARNEGIQQIRKVIRDVVREQGILRIGHYESIEALDRVRRQDGEMITEQDLTDEGSNCLADFLSRALAVGLFAKPPPKKDHAIEPPPPPGAAAPRPDPSRPPKP
jgi:hypothetical protein